MTATLVLALAAGAAFGTLYFGILWQSTRALTASVRLGGGAADIAAAGFGFVAAREILKRRVAQKPAAG